MYDSQIMTGSVITLIRRRPIVAILAAALYLGKAGWFFRKYPDFLQFWDWPGHVQKARIATWPWQGGWDTTFWGGYPTMVYPSGYHLLLKSTMALVGSVSSGAIILTLAIICFQLWGVWRFVLHYVRPPRQQLTYLVTLFLMVVAAGGQLGSLRGTIFTGGGPAALGTALVLWFFTASSWPARAAWLGWLFLVHPLSAIVVLIYLVIKIWYRDKGAMLALLVGAIIGLPWILPQLDPSFAKAALNLQGATGLLPFVIVAMLIVVMLERPKPVKPLLLTALATGLLSILPQSITDAIGLVGLRGLHFYRLEWYALILIPTIIATTGKFSLRPITKNVITGMLVVGMAVSGQPENPVRLNFNFDNLPKIAGRVIDASRHAGGMGYPQAAEHILAEKTTNLGSTRWIYESGARGLQYYALKNALDPKSFLDGTYTNTFSGELATSGYPLDIKHTADLLGVRYVSFTAQSIPENRPSVWPIGVMTYTEGGSEHQLYYLLEQVANTALATTLPTPPLSDPHINLGQWWLATDRSQLAIDSDTQPPVDLDLSQPPVDLISVEPTTIRLRVSSPKPAPTVLKFTWSPYWQVESMDSNSFVSDLYWITPGQIFFYGNGEILLTWKTPAYLRIFSPLSYIGLATTAAAGIWLGIKSRP